MAEKNIVEPEVEFNAANSRAGERESSTVAIVAIIATAVVLLGCLLSCAIIAYAFLSNAPW